MPSRIRGRRVGLTATLHLDIEHCGFFPLKDGRVQLSPLWGTVRCRNCRAEDPEALAGLPEPDQYECPACGGLLTHPDLDGCVRNQV
jgi:hypothetical protein